VIGTGWFAFDAFPHRPCEFKGHIIELSRAASLKLDEEVR
jgi:hypothetical protein